MKKLLFTTALLTAVSTPALLFAQNKATKSTKGSVAVDSIHRNSGVRTTNARMAMPKHDAANSGNSTSPNAGPKKVR